MGHSRPPRGSALTDFVDRVMIRSEQFLTKRGWFGPKSSKALVSGANISEALLKRYKTIGPGLLVLEELTRRHELGTAVKDVSHLIQFGFNFIGDILDGNKLHTAMDMGHIGKPLVDELLGQSMGISLQSSDGGAQKAVNTIYRVTGFVIVFQYASAALVTAGKLLLSERFPETIAESLGKMGEELGLSWMLGTLLERTFEQAVGQPFEELINRQTHPARLDMRVLKQLMRQHKIDPGTLDEKLTDLGYPADLRRLIAGMDDNQLSVHDIVSHHFNANTPESEVRKYLEGLGYTDGDIAIILDNYIHHAETGAKTMYRAAARSIFKLQHMTEDAFRAVLKEVGDSQESIDTEVKAIKLEQSANDHAMTVGMLKQFYVHKVDTPKSIGDELRYQGFSDSDVSNLFKLWDDSAVKQPKVLTASRILSFMHSKVISPEEANTKIQKLGYSPDDADMMVKNADVRVRKHDFGRTPGTIVAAYRHGVLDRSEAQSELIALGMDTTEARQRVDVVAHELLPKTTRPPGSAVLNKGDVAAALKAGVLDDYSAYDLLVHMGYDSMDAMIIVETHSPATNSGSPGGGIVPGGTHGGPQVGNYGGTGQPVVFPSYGSVTHPYNPHIPGIVATE